MYSEQVGELVLIVLAGLVVQRRLEGALHEIRVDLTRPIERHHFGHSDAVTGE